MKPNWIGPRATIDTQRKMETDSRIILAEDPIILDCLEVIRYQLPVCNKGLRSPSSEFVVSSDLEPIGRENSSSPSSLCRFGRNQKEKLKGEENEHLYMKPKQ